MKVLCIAEKPSIAKALAQALGGGQLQVRNSKNKYIKNYDISFQFRDWGNCNVTITSVMGHIHAIDFPKQYENWQAVQPSELFDAPVITSVKKENAAVAANIKSESRNANKLFIWTDCDREGENIGWEICQIARSGNVRLLDNDVKRAIFNNTDPTHLRQAALSPSNLDMKQANAVLGRIEFDLRVGAAFTRFLSMTLKNSIPALKEERVISYGSCQFPTLGFVVDRYKRVKNFKPEPFWYIDIKIKKEQKSIPFTWERQRLFDRMVVTLIFEKCLNTSTTGRITKVETKPISRYRPLPLTTIQLQKQGAKFLRMSSKSIMDTAERLYNLGFISYPRTETDQFDSAINLKSLIEKQQFDNRWGQYSKDLLEGKFVQPKKGRNNDKAHPPIHPIKGVGRDAGLNGDQLKVYEFVTRHFLACCSDDAKGKNTRVELDWAGEKFHLSGTIVLERNFLDVYPYIKWESNQIPQFVVDETVKIDEALLKDGKTTAPSHLTEPDLIQLMDNNGIGTDATMAEHIEKIITRGYVIKQQPGRGGGGTLPIMIPSNLGVALVESCDKIDFDMALTKPFLRKETEVMMKKICDGELTKDQFLNQTLLQYREAFAIANQKKNILIETVRSHF